MKAEKTEENSPTELIVQLSTELLEPNDYNPNRMSDAEFNELVNEVSRLGRLPKPIVVRPNGKPGAYLIVDGEHGWRAATKAGLKAVPCEIIEADNFEAMRQTYKRNQHGTHAPIALGQFFNRMMEERGLSQRALAKEIDISEGSIRNALQYAQAAGVRNDYAWETLTVRQVRLYNHLPLPIGDLWLDTGAKVLELLGSSELEANITVEGLEREERQDNKLCFPRWEALAQTGLVDVVRQIPNYRYCGFKKLIKMMDDWKLYEWRWARNGLETSRLRLYTRHYFLGAWAVRTDSMMDDALGYVIDTTTTPASFRLSPAQFEALVKEAKSHEEFLSLIKAAIINKGLSIPDKPWDARKQLQQAELDHFAPEYIKQSALDMRAKYALWKAEGREDIKREIAVSGITQSVLVKYDNDERVEWCIGYEIKKRTEDAQLKEDWEKLTTAQLVAGIAGRWGLYDPLTQQEQIKRLGGILGQLARAELMWLYRYTLKMEAWGAGQVMLKTLAMAIRT